MEFDPVSIPKHIKQVRKIIDEHKKPSKPLTNLLKIFDINHDGTLPSIVFQTQKEFLRSSNTERWEIEDRFSEKKDRCRPLFSQLGMIEEIKPSSTTYDYGIILGAAVVSWAHARISLCHEYLQNGITFKKLIVLASQRSLKSTIGLATTDDAPKTETEMMQNIINQKGLEQLRSIPTTFIDTPMQKTKKSLRAPNTGDTIMHWLAKENPLTGRSLVISNQPFVGYQDSVMRTMLPIGFEIDTVGNSASEINVSLFLDNLARWLYQENIQTLQSSL